MKVNGKEILLRDPQACRLAKIRAAKENRSAANSAATTIIESLSEKYGPELNKIQKQLDKIQNPTTTGKGKPD